MDWQDVGEEQSQTRIEFTKLKTEFDHVADPLNLRVRWLRMWVWLWWYRFRFSLGERLCDACRPVFESGEEALLDHLFRRNRLSTGSLVISVQTLGECCEETRGSFTI